MLNKFFPLIKYLYESRYIHYAVIGAFGTLLNLGTTYTLTEALHLYYMVSYVCATLGSWALIFFLHSRITFRGHAKNQQSVRFLKFIMVYGVGFVTNSAFVYALTEWMHLYYILSIVVTTLVLSLGTFVINKREVFQHT